MKQPTYFKFGLAILMLFLSFQSFSQNLRPFVPRYDGAIRGDMLLIGNSNLSVHRTDPYDYTGTSSNNNNEGSNNRGRMVYVDIDSDNSTFNSSSANLDVPSAADCYQIAYAGLYWSSVVRGNTANRNAMQNIKFKTPGSSNYIDLTGTQIYYQNSNNNTNSNTFVYYRDVTDIISNLGPNREGTYTVANISSMTSQMMGNNLNTEGLSAGWSLFVIYEDPTMPSKYITSFDGFTKINNQGSDRTQEFLISGFQTIPTGPVNAKYAFSALEGDRAWSGDELYINNFRMSATTSTGTVIRPSNNFFNSSVSIINPVNNTPIPFTSRNPASLNTLGFDAGIINVPNAGNTVIANGATSANIRLSTNTDIYYFYFSAFAIEIIAPKIVLTKIVEDAVGNDIGGQTVSLGDELYYTIGFQNTGNDNATSLTIRDILPENVVFNYPQDLDLLPAGVSVQSYNPTTKELIFNVSNSVVEKNDPVSEIRFKVTVVATCSLLSNACSNSINNQAFATYRGTVNPTFTISDDPSFSSNTGCLVNPGPTNFLANLNDCVFEENVILCGASTVLTAGSGYDQYSWSTSPTGTPVIGTSQSLTVTTPGTYYVHNTAVAPCQSIDQVFNVITYGAGVTNPLLPFADQVTICPNDGKQLPNIFLCGANDSRVFQTNITDTSSMIWEKLDESSCSAVTDIRCANESDNCTWHQVATGPDFTADTAGQYRLTLNYTGGCYNEFYFNVYENVLEPSVSTQDIICTTPGQITVGGVPTGYEYSLDGVNYQPSNVFAINTPNVYTVYIRQVGVSPNPCIFTVPNVQIRQRDFTVSTIVEQPFCNGERGSVVLAANDVRAQYTFSIFQGGTLINSSGLIMENNFTFGNLNPGTYTYEVSTQDGCFFTDSIEIINPPVLTATVALTQPLTCTDGEITVYPNGGTAPYYIFVNGSTEFQSNRDIVVTTAGVYNIRVVDANNCEVETSITVNALPQPVYTVTDTDILCYNSNNGAIQFNVSNANGYTIAYSIDNGVTYTSNPTFTNLAPGTYATNIRYSLNDVECFSTVQNLTITQPTSAVTASAGVSELAGCGPGGTGRVRITNPQGGTAPYQYSFDNQATWTTTNEAYVNPGTYTLYIRDANGCTFPMHGITLDPEPVAPTISVSDPDFNCEGDANSTVTVTNPDNNSFTYRYLLNGVENTNTVDPRTFLNVPSGNHTITVEYTLASVPTYSNLLFEDFGSGAPTTTSGIAAAYCFNDQRVNAPYNCGTRSVEDNQYSVASFFWRPDDPSSNNSGAWYHFRDHTTNGADPNGRYLLVNIGSAAGPYGILYSKPISNVIPNQDIRVELYLGNLIRASRTGAKPDFIIQLVDDLGNVIAAQNVGEIENNEQWNLKTLALNPGNNENLTFVIRSGSILYGGNDAVIDDITVYQLPAICTTTVDFPFIVASGNGFSAQILNSNNATCAGANDGTVTISAQNFNPALGFQYSIDNGATWATQLASPYTITGLAPGSYDIQVRYDSTADSCVESFVQPISAPAVLEIAALATPITCDENSTITVSATGGSPAYVYELLDTSLNLVMAIPNSGILSNVVAGDYIVRVTDINGCDDTIALNIAPYTSPTASLVNIDYCYDGTGSSFEVSVSGGLAPYQYSVNGSAYTSNNTFNNLVPGSYTVTVIDAYGCPVTLPALTIAPQVAVSTVLTKELDCTVSPDAVITGTISNGYAPYTVTLIQGTGTVNLTGNTFTLTTATHGAYQFRVTDANGCETISDVTTISPLVEPTATTTVVDATCNGNSDGSVQIIPSGGVGPYTFSFEGSPFTATSLYTGLAEGTYNYVVRDANECTFEGSVTIGAPDPLVATASATAFMCSADNTAQSATVTIGLPTGGTAPYLYSFNGSGYSANNTLTVNDNGSTQVIAYSVRDANGCTNGGSVSIDPLNSPTDLTFASTAVTCTTTTSTVTLTATNGVGPLTYEILSPIVVAPQTSNVFTGLAPDTYVFRVTDANGCYYTESFTINPVTPIAVIGTKLSDVLCFGDNTGAIQFTVSGDSGTYTSVLSPNTGTLNQVGNVIDITGLVAGSYTLEVVDTATGCTDTETIVIDQPGSALGLTATATHVHCNNDESQITVAVTGGSPNYTYAAVITGNPAPSDAAYASGNIITVDTNLGLIWDVYVKDANGCIEMETVTIVPDPMPTVTAPTVANQCTANSGFTFTVTATGIAPLSYSINGGASYQSSPIFTVNAPGSYTITVRDANGCTATSATTTEVYAPITASVLLTQDLTCFATPDASIDINVSGGLAPYTYEVSSDGGTTYTSISGSPFTTGTPGDYRFRITDANGCNRITSPVTVNPIVNPEITSVVPAQNILCNGEETGALNITINTSLGLAPFVINVLNTTTGFDYGTQTTGLAAGDYTITVTDAKGCTDTQNYTIMEPTAIVMDFDVTPITCGASGVSLGEIIINSVTGGTPNYIYHVTGVNGYNQELTGQTGTTQVFEVVDFGLYQIIITDANGCAIIEKDILVASPPDDLDIDVAMAVNCATGGEAEVSIGAGTTMTGAGPFYFAIYTGFGMAWDGIPGGSATWQLGAGTPVSTTFTGLIPGATYTFIVYDDDTKCYYYETADAPISTNSTLIANALVANNITCVGSADGNVSFNIVSDYGIDIDVNYEILDSQSLVSTGITGSGTIPANGTLPVSNLGPLDFGNYVIVITEQAGAPNVGCGIVTEDFNITQSAIDLTVTASVSKNENCNELGVLSAIAQHGTAPYVYQVVPTTTSPDPDPSSWVTNNTFERPEGEYDVYVRDIYGCEKFATVTIIKDTEPTINPVDSQCFDGITPLNITLVGTTFNSIATYSIGGAFQASPNFTITAAGTYNLTVRDANGCEATTPYVVNSPLLLDATLDLDLTCTDGAEITLTPSGGTGTYDTYEVSNDAGVNWTDLGGSTYTAPIAGTYIFRVTDSQHCIALSNEIIVATPTTPTLTYAQINVSCNGGADGSIVVTAVAGIAPFEYSNDGGTTWQTSNVFSGLIAGDYSIVVRDSKNCESLPVLVTITEPTALIASASVTPFSCNVDNVTQSATVTIDVPTTGTTPYQYSFNGLAYTSTNTFTLNDNGAIQTITFSVRDGNGCIFSDSIDIEPLNSPTDLDFDATDVTCVDLTSEVTLTATNGVGALTYEIIFPASATSNVTGASTGIFTGLAPDTYLFRVTDANGCYYTESYTVVPVINITVSGQLISDANCNAEANGSIEFDVSNFASTYSYSINGGLSIGGQTDPTISITGLAAGDYTIVVTDEITDCTATATVTVSEPEALTLTETSNINAYCDFGAIITVQASGGTAPYRYAFVEDGVAPIVSDYTTSNTAVLDPAISTDWDVYVMDANDCPNMIDVVIATDPLPTFDVPTFAINQCTVDTGFEFTVTNVVGVGPFTYSIGNGFQSSPTFTVSTAGTYTVTVRDAHGCTNTVPVSIEIYPVLDLNAAVTALVSCSDDDGEITITGAGGSGSYTYSITPSPASISLAGNVFSGVPAGTYTLTITDDVTGCSDDVDVTLEVPTPVNFTTTPTDVSCIGGNDGTIMVNLPASNDNPVYTYAITVGPETRAPQTSNVFTGLAAGEYTVLVTSGRGCFATEDVTIDEPAAITVPAPLVVEYACTVNTNSSNFATITITGVTGGSETFTRYEFIRNGSIVQNGANNVYTETDFLGGSYEINVYDDNNCVGSTTATVLPFISIDDLDVTIDNAITCINDEDITVSVTSTGGTPANLEFTLEDFAGILPTQTNATGIFTGLPVGNYIITVTDLDSGCTLQTVHYINEPNAFDLTVDSVVDVTCFAGSDGSVNVTFIDRSPLPTDESGPFSYEIFDNLGNSVETGTASNPGSIAITGLASGTYTITATLTNDPYCTVSKNFTISAPTAALAIAETHTEITCVSGNNDGTISVTATGGWPGGYEYQLEISGGAVLLPFGTVSNFTGLTANTYIVTVRDSRGCEDSVTVTLDIPDSITATVAADISLLDCFGDTNATITASAVSGGQGSNYTYTLNMISPVASSSGPQLSPVFSGLGAGTYTVTVRDGFNCEFTSADVVINEPTEVQALLVRDTSPTCLTDATLILSATGGTAPYEYSATASFATILGTFTSSSNPIPVSVGTYEYYVRDSNGCIASVSNEITIDPVPPLVINLDLTNATINCAGDNTGVIVAVAQGGLGNYVYTLLDNGGNPIPTAVQNSPGVFTELFAGTYQVRVDSGDCDYETGTITISEPASPLTASFTTTDPTCFGSGDGVLEIMASGGTGVIKYAISPQLNQFFETSVFEDLYPGTYQAIAQDELGCYILFDFTITDPAPVQIALVPNSIVPELCEGDLNGSFSVVISGGAMPYSVALDNRNGSYVIGDPTQVQFDFAGLSGGNHIVYVIDGVGCETEVEIVFPESVSFDAIARVDYDCDNNMPGNTITVNVTGNIDIADVMYSLNGGTYQTSNLFVNVPSGVDNYVDVMHSNGCIQTTPLFDVDHFDPLEVVLVEVADTFNTIEAITAGGSGVYYYTLNGEDYGTKNTFIIYSSGNYTVTVTDSYGCSVSETQYFEYIDVCIPNYFTPDDDNINNDSPGWGPGCATQYVNLTVDIFDRYGRAIATLRVGDFWDGKYNGRELPTGDYWYVVKLNDPKDNRQFVGHFTLYR